MSTYIKYFSFSLICAVLFGCGASRTSTAARDPFIQLRKNIQNILSDSLFLPCNASLKIVSLKDGRIFFEQNNKKLLHPASNMKLLTSAAALSILDTNFLAKTSVLIDSDPNNGILPGNLYLKGYGNPDLETANLDSLARAIKSIGIWRIEGDLVVDDSFFDDTMWGPGWTWDDESDPDAPYISALSVNKNCIKLMVFSDSASLYVYKEPFTDFVEVQNSARVTGDSILYPLKVRRSLRNDFNTIFVTGEIGKYSQYVEKLALRRPEYYCGTLFKESLERNGIVILGEVIKGISPGAAREITQYSQPIRDIVVTMNKASDNLSAENLLKIVSVKNNGIPGSTKSGLFAVKRYLASLGLDTTAIYVADGSGVSRYNLLSADFLVQFLIAVYRDQKIFPVFYNSLPIAGNDGTLSKRMTYDPAYNNIRAKTGTLNGASCLSGYARTKDGEMLAFSLMMQNFITPVADYRFMQDRICALLAGFSRHQSYAIQH